MAILTKEEAYAILAKRDASPKLTDIEVDLDDDLIKMLRNEAYAFGLSTEDYASAVLTKAVEGLTQQPGNQLPQS